jgi:hypothetical protein
MAVSSLSAFALLLLVSLPAVMSFTGGALVTPAVRMRLAASPRVLRRSGCLATTSQLSIDPDEEDNEGYPPYPHLLVRTSSQINTDFVLLQVGG